MHKLKSHAEVKPVALTSLRDDLPDELVATVTRMMAKDPNERYLTPSEVAQALESFLRTWQPGEEHSHRQVASNGGNHSDSGGQKRGAGDWNPSRLPIVAKWLLYTSLLPIVLLILDEFVPLGVFGAETDWFWYCLLTSIALPTIGAIMLGIHQATERERDDHRTNRSTTDRTLLMIVVLAVSALGYFRYTSDGAVHIEVTPQDESDITADDRFPADGNRLATASTSPSKPELKVTGKTVNKGTAGLPSLFDWNFKGRDVGDLKVRLLLAQNGKTEVMQEFDFEELPTEFAAKVRLEVRDDATGADHKRRVNAILFFESPVPSRSATVNEDKGLSIDVEAPFSNKIERADLAPIAPGQTELLLALSYWKGDMTNDLSMESMTAATKGGNATFLFVTLDWKPIGENRTDDSEVDLGLLQGKWETESLTESGKQLATENGFGGFLLQIKGNTFVIGERKPNGEESEVNTGRIEINTTTSPKTIDFIGRAQSTLGIYEFEDGVLRICLAEQGGNDAPAGARIPDTKHLKRPTTFDSPAGSNIMLIEFTKNEPAKENDIPNIQGTWQVTYSEDGGRIAPQEMLKELRFVIDEHNLTTEIGGRKSVSTYKLDSSTNPAAQTI